MIQPGNHCLSSGLAGGNSCPARCTTRGAGNHPARRVAELEGKLEFILGEELVEHFAAQGAGGDQLVGPRVMFEQDRGERLRCRPGHHAGAFGRIVLAVLGAAVDHLRVLVARACSRRDS